MNNGKYKNTLITERDKDILSILQKLKVARSSELRCILSPNTCQNTFTKRLKKLQDAKLLRKIWEEFTNRNQHWSYQLDIQANKDRIEQITGSETIWKNIGLNHSSYWHSLHISHLLAFLLRSIRKASPNYLFSSSKFISQYEFQKRLNSEWDTTKCPIIPDGLLIQWKNVFWMEAERLNSAKDFKNKMSWYVELSFRLNDGKCPFFEKDSNHALVIMAAGHKKTWYSSIIEKEGVKDSWKTILVDKETVVWI